MTTGRWCNASAVCDRTNSAGDAFVKLQEIFLNGMISITPAQPGAEQGPLRLAWDGTSGYISATSQNVFQITSLDPMSNDAAWFRVKCVSTGLIQLRPSDVFTLADSGGEAELDIDGGKPMQQMAARHHHLQHLHLFVRLLHFSPLADVFAHLI